MWCPHTFVHFWPTVRRRVVLGHSIVDLSTRRRPLAPFIVVPRFSCCAREWYLVVHWLRFSCGVQPRSPQPLWSHVAFEKPRSLLKPRSHPGSGARSHDQQGGARELSCRCSAVPSLLSPRRQRRDATLKRRSSSSELVSSVGHGHAVWASRVVPTDSSRHLPYRNYRNSL